MKIIGQECSDFKDEKTGLQSQGRRLGVQVQLKLSALKHVQK
jgi:hypothetical protein